MPEDQNPSQNRLDHTPVRVDRPTPQGRDDEWNLRNAAQMAKFDVVFLPKLPYSLAWAEGGSGAGHGAARKAVVAGRGIGHKIVLDLRGGRRGAGPRICSRTARGTYRRFEFRNDPAKAS